MDLLFYVQNQFSVKRYTSKLNTAFTSEHYTYPLSLPILELINLWVPVQGVLLLNNLSARRI